MASESRGYRTRDYTPSYNDGSRVVFSAPLGEPLGKNESYAKVEPFVHVVFEKIGSWVNALRTSAAPRQDDDEWPGDNDLRRQIVRRVDESQDKPVMSIWQRMKQSFAALCRANLFSRVRF